MEFFHGFNFDTVLAIISCITGIVALFLGGTAYKNCKISKNTVKQKKKFDAGSTDNSITVGGDYNHSEGISETGLISVIDKMNAMTSASFSTALDGAYTMFQAKCDDNLHTIMEKTEKRSIQNEIRFYLHYGPPWQGRHCCGYGGHSRQR